jgi:hypothetical protein
MVFASSVGHASPDQKPNSSAAEICAPAFARTKFMREFLGTEPGGNLAAAADRFLSSYMSAYRDVPSFETYRERLRANHFTGDDHMAYDLVQRMHLQSDDDIVRRLARALSSLEELAGPARPGGAPKDLGALEYGHCVKDVIEHSLATLPDTSFYDFKREQVMAILDGPTRARPSLNAPIDSSTGAAGAR